MVTIIADEGKNQIGADLYQGFISKGVQAEYISLEHVEVKPCVSCGGCTYKTYGKCTVRDDGDFIYPKVIRSDVIIFVSPITFGSYSFKLKRVFDKFALIMDRHYFVEKKELVKGGKLGSKFKFFAIGDKENCIEEEITAFQNLFHENLVITKGIGNSYITEKSLSEGMRNQIIEEVRSA
ncbi:flavodoxin family protein [Lachnoclostridium phytofermentans]|uniref:Multimeric flavodoxin WrbA-like protein n=1 Tax=Lachnoclostridium phytofermentans (strain ATCC 700394 / DSM 18823 / ISDg) TaxID=357809 RepID=A9KSZ8_LACP7|nr:NAD(P)H-dependent oxidoreductase [Lachnoclostridium phytofermentans]ABX42209.1 Multimeric flavodoxin WrbA-like protein [Lachnoclostridium phytofermentans ISDg]